MKQLWPIRAEKITSSKNESGFVLPLVLVVTALILSVSGLSLLTMRQRIKDDKNYLAYSILTLIQRSALEECQAEIIHDPQYIGTDGKKKQLNGGDYSIEVVRQSDREYYAEIDAHYDRYEKRFTGTITLDESGRQISEINFITE